MSKNTLAMRSCTYVDSAELFSKIKISFLKSCEIGRFYESNPDKSKCGPYIFLSRLSGLETKTPNQKDTWDGTVRRGAASS